MHWIRSKGLTLECCSVFLCFPFWLSLILKLGESGPGSVITQKNDCGVGSEYMNPCMTPSEVRGLVVFALVLVALSEN